MRIFWPAAKSDAPPWTSKREFISAPYQGGMRCGTKKTKISLGVVAICVASSMRDILMERYLINSEWCEEVKRFNTECTEEERRTQRKRERSFDRLGAKAPASLRKITQGRQDDDAHRIVRGAEDAEKDQGQSATMLTLWQAGAQRAAPLPLDWRARQRYEKRK